MEEAFALRRKALMWCNVLHLQLPRIVVTTLLSHQVGVSSFHRLSKSIALVLQFSIAI